MLTYDFEHIEGPMYLHIYQCIKQDILEGNLQPGEKLPSKRTFASHNGISTITVQNAYDQLVSEGYIYTLPKRGYFVTKLEGMQMHMPRAELHYDIELPKKEEVFCDLAANGIPSENFPFSVWAKISREVMAEKKEELMEIAPVSGVWELREAIAGHLQSFRGMLVDPNQIVVGAGTECLYGFITELLGRDKKYTIENPGYQKLASIYQQREIICGYAPMDEKGVTVEGLQASATEVAHICPNHHFPTGITMPASRRYEVLSWANGKEGRYIIEDDYDSEFRVVGKPIPTLFSIDGCEKVIYMNTFSKSLTPTIRISYMVLPVHLANRFYETMSFYSCTVSNFEQYTLAQFIRQGYFEKHINRMRLYYGKQRRKIMETIEKSRLNTFCRIQENDSGLHFLVRLATAAADGRIVEEFAELGIKVRALSEYYVEGKEEKQHFFIINYSNLEVAKVREVIERLEKRYCRCSEGR